MFEQVLFYAFSGLVLFAAVMVITVKNPVHAALCLVLAFFSSSGLWLLLEAEFLAITLVLVYVGAVMVLFLFVVMMLDINIAELREGFARYVPIAVLVAAVMLALLSTIVGHLNFGVDAIQGVVAHASDYSNTKALGMSMYTDFIWPFEIASVILLVAIVAAITLTLRKSRQTKSANPNNQVGVKSSDRVRLVKVPSEPQE
ncbi:NADH-quinone oxidoreductase subunit J [Gammaproteobacteria bacterium]|nr:NADH-quinone oxidoreductase subunit J [Gammaproteobacteria bacterium]